MSQPKRFISRKITGYRREDSLLVLSSDTTPFIVDCRYELLWGLIKFNHSHKVDVRDGQFMSVVKYWKQKIAENAE